MMHRRIPSGAGLLALMVSLAMARPAGAQSYTPVDLGTLGGTASKATAVSSQAHIVGQANNKAFFFNGTMTGLGTLGGATSIANALNALDLVVGQADTSGGTHHAFSFPSGGPITDLGTLEAANAGNSAALGVNNNGQIAGQSDVSATAHHAFVILSSTMADLGTLGGTNSVGNGINDSAQVVGQADTPTASHAIIWDPVNGLRDLGTLGGSNSTALAINGGGFVVGQADTGTASHAFLYDGSTMADLGTLEAGNAGNSQANALNNIGTVVGQSDTTSGAHAFVWDSDHGMVDLNTLISSGSGWVLQSATGVDDHGDIVGLGTIGGQTHAFLLRPILASVFLNPKTVYGGAQQVTGTVTLTGPAGAGGVTVSLSSTDGHAVFDNNGSTSSSFTVPQGATSGTFLIDTGVVGSDTHITISATFGSTTESDTLTLLPILDTIAVSPGTVVGGAQSSTLTVLLHAAPLGNVTANLSSTDGHAVFDNNGSTSSSLTIPAGSKSATVNVDTQVVGANLPITISANVAGFSASKTLTLTPLLKSVSLNPASVIGGSQPSTLTVTLNLAVQGSVSVNLNSSSGLVTFANNGSTSSSISIGGGSNAGTMMLNTGAVKSTTKVSITGSLNGASFTQVLTLNPLLKGFSFNPKTIVGGCQHVTGTISLGGPAPAGGLSVSVSSSSGILVFDNNGSTSSAITVPAGQISVNFLLDSNFVGAKTVVTLQASVAGLVKKTTVTVNPALSSVQVSPGTVVGGLQPATVTVNLVMPPLSNVSVGLASSDGHAVWANNASTSSSITVPAGQSSVTIAVNTGLVSANLPVTLSANLASLTVSTTLNLQPAIATLSLAPSSVVGGLQTSTATVTLNATANLGAVSVSLSSSSGDVVFANNGSTSSSMTIPAGATSATTVLTTAVVGANANVLISASIAGVTQTSTLTLTPAFQSISLSPSTVKGGNTSTLTITLAAPSTGQSVSLTSSDGHAVFANNASTSSNLTIPNGQTSATIVINTSSVSSNLNVTITVGLAGLNLSQTLTITP